jgi:hypothetical protein
MKKGHRRRGALSRWMRTPEVERGPYGVKRLSFRHRESKMTTV